MSATAPLPASNKGAATRETIIDRAYGMACSAGLDSLSIGTLALAVGMSKSGVFAHFGSREGLQLAVLESAGLRFGHYVLVPALAAPRGLPRLRAIVERWFDWVRHSSDGGCLYLAAVSEFDDRPGAIRDSLLQHEVRWRNELARAIQLTLEAGELHPDTDAQQLAFEIYGLALIVHHDAGLFGYDAARLRGQRAFERLIRSYSPTSP
jgi:AcrR family transcriptional regulator